MPMRRSPLRAESGRVVDMGKELLCALDFTFCRYILQGEVSFASPGA